MARRLTENQKLKMVEGFRLGSSSTDLAREFGCSSNTINRIVKSILSKEEYQEVKRLRKKEKVEKADETVKASSHSSVKKNNEQVLVDPNFEKINGQKNIIDTVVIKSKDSDLSTINEQSQLTSNVENDSNVFKEVAPLVTDFGFEDNPQKVISKSLDDINFPQILFMIVNQKVELEPKLLGDFPEWSFLPDDEKSRNAISLFDNQRAAKRNCLRGQKVVKIPNSNVLNITSNYIVMKGITRIVFDDILITLD